MKKLVLFLLLWVLATPLVAGPPSVKKAAIDPDDAYKNNCVRCHSEVQQYSPYKTATIVLHMRIRANLTKEETQAILEYLNGGSTPIPAVKIRTR